MRNRLVHIFITMLAISVIAVPTVSVRAQSSGSSSSPSVSDTIVSGLWSGINFIWPGSTSRSTTTTGSTGTGSSSTTRQPSRTTTAPSPRTANTYVAIGDSVAAGVGLSTPADVPERERRCERTSEAYPYQVARSLDLPLINVTCSGATTRDFYTRDWSPAPSQAAQLDTAFAGGTPKVISITAGANDIRWVGFLQRCYSSNCATTLNKQAVDSLLISLQSRLVRVMNDIKTRSGTTTPPTVIITGYYNPVSPACTAIEPRATADEITWITGGVNALNQTIRQVAANYPNVRYASVDFSGHDICSSDSWVQGQNDLRPFHPTAEGHQVIAESVISAAR